jgi:hypothetical protein
MTRSPTKCPKCGHAPVNDLMLKVPDACICDKCRHVFGLTLIPVVSPSKEELEGMLRW